MPRLEDGELLVSASKFKKRRAWIRPDDSDPIAKERPENPLITTRVEHDCNMSVTRVEQEISLHEAIKQKSESRVEHDYNKSVTRVEHDYNRTRLSFELEKLFASIERQKASIINYEDDPRSLILSLSDAQKRIFWHIAIECITRSMPRTGPIEIKSFFDKLAISTPVVRTTLNRLVDKRIIQREKGKLGKNGFAVISLPRAMFEAALAIVADLKGQS